ncbi:MAG: exo-alpha-sialidase [Pirellulales bacterium]
MLDLPGTGTDPTAIDFFALPTLAGEHALVSQGDDEWQFRLHNYLAWHDGRYWCIWSHGPVIEDQARQEVRYATSDDGLHWSEPATLTGPPPDEYGYIARGLWLRDGQLLALVSLYEAPTAFYGDLELRAFAWNAATGGWDDAGLVFDDAINNFPPKPLPSGEWLMSRRDAQHHVTMLIGGVKALDDWSVVPVAKYTLADGARVEEPYWWALPDGRLMGLFRDNSRSRRIYRAFSSDDGASWSTPARTNFPDATSKFFALRTSRGYWVMVSNPNPAGRRPLCLSLSTDGETFTRMAQLPIESERGQTLQYPHVIEHDDHLLVAFSRNKRAIEVVRIALDETDRLLDDNQ